MKLLSLLASGFETVQFPSDLCTVQNPREKDVKDAPSDVLFLCILLDDRFDNQGRFIVLHPYIAKNLPGEKPRVLYGWTDGNNVFDHCERSINLDHEKVVAWKRLDGPLDLRE